MRNHILKTGAALLAAGIFLFVSNLLLSPVESGLVIPAPQ